MIIYDHNMHSSFYAHNSTRKKKRSNPFIATGWISKTLAGRDGLEGFQGHWPLVWIAYAEIFD